MGNRKYLINASNLHVGGGVQVATSFIGELTNLSTLPQGLVVWVSSKVDSNLRDLGCNLSKLPHYKVIDNYGLKSFFLIRKHSFSSFDAVLTVFGPLYCLRNNFYNIVGFAQPWLLYPNNEIYEKLTCFEKIKIKLKFNVQKFFFKRADKLLVELEHVSKKLCSLNIVKSTKVEVVHNCISSTYLNKGTWINLNKPINTNKLKLGFIGRNYDHKNTSIFPEVRKVLLERHSLDVEFFVTFTDAEWESCTEVFKENINNVGALSVAQCPAFYQNMDAIVFPSLLECFSATPLEAMVMQKPLFASDRPFNRDICFEHAHYFDPLSPSDAASVIAEYFIKGADDGTALISAKRHALNFSCAKNRAKQYLECLIKST